MMKDIEQGQLIKELEDKRITKIMQALDEKEPAVFGMPCTMHQDMYYLSLKHTAEYLLDRFTICPIELVNGAVSDTTGDASSNVAGNNKEPALYKIAIERAKWHFNCFKLGDQPPLKSAIIYCLEEMFLEGAKNIADRDSNSVKVNWIALRDKFFVDCTIDNLIGTKKISMAPHDLFEWFKKQLETDSKAIEQEADKTAIEAGKILWPLEVTILVLDFIAWLESVKNYLKKFLHPQIDDKINQLKEKYL